MSKRDTTKLSQVRYTLEELDAIQAFILERAEEVCNQIDIVRQGAEVAEEDAGAYVRGTLKYHRNCASYLKRCLHLISQIRAGIISRSEPDASE